MPYDSKYFGTDGEPLIRIRDLSTTDVETRYNGPQLTEYRVSRNTLLVGMDGEFNTGRWRLSEPALLNQRVLAIESGPYWSKWLEYCLPFALNVLNDLAYSTTVKHLSSFEVARVRIPTPPEGEMKKIVNYLDHETAEIDAFINELSSLGPLLAEEHETMRVMTLGSDDADVPRTRLKFCSYVTVGIVVNPSVWYANQGVPALRGTNIKSERIDLNDIVRITDEGHAFHNKSALSTGDVVVVRTGQAGTAATIPDELDGSNAIDLLVIKPGPTLDGKYLAAYINSRSARRHFEAGTVGAIQGHFNVESLKNLEIPVPPREQQIAHYREWETRKMRMRTASQDIQQAIDLARERRAALITAAVTGQIDVTTKNKPAAEQIEDDIAQGLHREYA